MQRRPLCIGLLVPPWADETLLLYIYSTSTRLYILFYRKLQWGLLLGLFFLFFLLLASKTCISPFYWLYVIFICNKRRIPLSLGWIVSNVMYPIYSKVILKFNLSSMPAIPPQLFFKTCFESEAKYAVNSACDCEPFSDDSGAECALPSA